MKIAKLVLLDADTHQEVLLDMNEQAYYNLACDSLRDTPPLNDSNEVSVGKVLTLNDGMRVYAKGYLKELNS